MAIGVSTDALFPDARARGRCSLHSDITQTDVSAGEIIVNGFDMMHQRSGADLHYGSMSLTLGDFDAAAKAISGREFAGKRRLRPDEFHLVRFFRGAQHSNGWADEFPEQQKHFKVNQKPRNSPASNTPPD